MTPAQQHKNWRPDVADVVADVERVFPTLECVTYVDHPWPGWDGRSFDVWHRSAWWDPAAFFLLRKCRRYLMRKHGLPNIRHTILGHRLWTSFGGLSRWIPDDHSGRWRHLHVTYW